jgi:hypothetical protein
LLEKEKKRPETRFQPVRAGLLAVEQTSLAEKAGTVGR